MLRCYSQFTGTPPKELSVPPVRRQHVTMKQTLIQLSQNYVTALRTHLKSGSGRNVRPALALGRRAVTLGVETLGLARIHEYALTTLHLSGDSGGLMKRSEQFFTEAITPIVETHRAARQSQTDLNRLKQTLGLRTQ
jgi:hypothetical protein